MIVGTNYVFVAVSKTGSVTMRDALKAHAQPVYEQDPFPPVNSWMPFPELRRTRNSHLTIAQINSVMDTSKHFKFGFVRNPWDRFVSFCAWTSIVLMNKRDGKPILWRDNPRFFMRCMVDQFKDTSAITTMTWQCHRFLSDPEDKIAVDFVGRFERYQESFDYICDQIGHPRANVGHRNKSFRDPDYRTYYDTQLVDKVAERYKRDIELFGYKFE